ncbi:RimJ/RimL family protein N-acetyltransferase [Clostridium saccharoperbutylacetonicum]|uniref:Acetyltransferase n=1 Tax=Clostridium saccharoperbutylacetonicum N1-4(HMT) TaxID=931276 RepID=M1MFJ8_9CLOT|nr:GNAT family protein [Clostridium saccharoperbutylacetonicum]AGF55153.1 acetyltransferase [Clostridium saccharoperbutylacetonicum N1-4(HMT)]NRT64136.1 RimJ/RimL family protein N-acetyltransferase [Clostridium saccharoperbutylacetonicum]NSB27503.1 RimJ/RimL family protein N-acetyltransferase [Clostridium saccharoperbutylacetonicum]NSB40992.1 RimJ/RimL family protein N-acetyltransferase [Clostridium saccharoperbutylacetonicum]
MSMLGIDYEKIIRKTDRLIIRPMQKEDFLIVKENLDEQGSQKNKYDEEEIEFVHNYTEEVFEKHLKASREYSTNDNAYTFKVFKKSDGKYIGGIIIKTIQRKNFQWSEIGYWLLNQYWGNGYGSELIKAGIDIAFKELGFHRVEAQINLDNIASQRAAENAGMELECIRKGFIYEFGEWTDNMVYMINNIEDTKH